ncbi:RimK/LysX family protein [Alcanivorax sp. S6407]|uniref:ATP-dependent zinc protease family protein n=1 Tax=Alcanivorax sp. S6407 TaxID=2926424 RepID=UPI001FF1ABF6|nr:RimK/LysX family protein [Alcanivorax sp. S6407]MCK0153615.1 RimK/LysX family protein [Alcanivorax sp. S6407]
MRFPLWLLLAGCVLVAHADVPTSKVIYGLNEHVQLRELGVTVPAKLDTGAESASLSARHIRVFERDGVDMVEFDLALMKQDREALGISREQWDDIQLPLVGHVRIKRLAESLVEEERGYNRRPMVMLTVCMGRRAEQIEVNLTDRSDFSYPLLIGADALKRLGAVVDPSLVMTAGHPRCTLELDEEGDDMTEAAEAQ